METEIETYQMRLFRILLFAVPAMSVFASCDKTDNQDHKVVDTVRLSASFNIPSLDLLWGEDWKDYWQYDWDSSDTTYGTLGYSTPEILKGTIYNLDANTGKRYSSFFKLFGLKESPVSLPASGRYDMLLYNFTKNVIFEASDDFEKYTASTIITPNGYDSLGVYNHLDEPDEFLGVMLTGIDFSKATSDSIEIGVDLKPYSIIYLIQVVIMNNNDVITGARDITVSGLAQGVDLFTRKTFNKTIFISTEDVKPLQNHKNVRLEDGTVVENAEILAARMLTWGLPDINPMVFSKVDTKVPEQESNYMAVDLMLRDGRRYTKVLNITEQMYNKPAGGVITVCVDVNDIALLIE